MRFAPAVFLSAVLLFLVQSLPGKQLLPWFGGAPGTWAACVMFFQGLLLAGYALAWVLDKWCPPRRRMLWHGLLLVAGAIHLAWWARTWGHPLLAPEAWKPAGAEAGIGLILKVIAGGAGLPFVILAATSPLLQRRAAECGVPATKMFRLYALSNAGSLLGLLSYPFVLEPRWGLPQLADAWAWGFALLAVVFLVTVLPARTTSAAEAPAVVSVSVGWKRRAGWVLLSAVASAVLLATTNQLCQEIAMVPFLWVLPLALYLTAFMIAFHDARCYRRERMAAPGALLSLAALGFSVPGLGLPVSWVMIVLGTWLFVFCWMCLGELYRLRPGAGGLTEFYLAIAFGGLLGGLAVGVGAPLLLNSVTEFPWTMLAGWSLLTVIFWRDRGSPLRRGGAGYYPATVFFCCGGLLLLISLTLPKGLPFWIRGWPSALGAGAVLTLLAWFITRPFPGWQQWRGWAQLLTGMVLFFAFAFTLDDTRGAGVGTLARGRNFFGAVRVQEDQRDGVAWRRLVHGQVNHGIQFTDPSRRAEPAGYCDTHSGVALAINSHPRRQPPTGQPLPLNIGVAGLGVGAMAAHMQSGDHMRFYEINPLVTAWAAGRDAWFTFINDSKGTVDTVGGDARLALEHELSTSGSRAYDILILDAFSSDSVPVHLLTIEAFTLYLRHLRDDDSRIAVNISNRYLDFRPLLQSVARHFGLHVSLHYHPGLPPVPTANLWMILRKPRPGESMAPAPDVPILWTDAHSDIFSLLRWSDAPLSGLRQ